MSTVQFGIFSYRTQNHVAKRKRRISAREQDPHRAREAKKYSNPIPSREYILQLLEESGPLDRDAVATALSLKSDDDLEALRRRLKAMCRESQTHRPIRYLSLADHARWAPALLEGWVPDGAVVAFDAIDRIAGQRDWERAILAVFHELQDTGGVFAAAADAAPSGCPWALADLGSRLGWGGVYALAPLDDEGKLRALQARAARRGLALSDPVARYLMARQARHPAHLFAVLDTLDRAALAAQRRLTIPLVRVLLDEADRAH